MNIQQNLAETQFLNDLMPVFYTAIGSKLNIMTQTDDLKTISKLTRSQDSSRINKS